MRYCFNDYMASVFYKKDGDIYQIVLDTDGTFDTAETGFKFVPADMDERDQEAMDAVVAALNEH